MAMKLPHGQHLAYCTNVHPAESWAETMAVLRTEVLAVREKVSPVEPFAIGLRLSARAAEELLADSAAPLLKFRGWLADHNCYVFTINGFPYGSFHHTRVKEEVYRPDWTSAERLIYTNRLFVILSELCPRDTGGSVSTLPGSFKEFEANEDALFMHLYTCARFIEELAKDCEKDLHLGLEPEPLGHFENTEETIGFFNRFSNWAEARGFPPERIYRYLGVNYDTCHFALEFDEPVESLQALTDAGLRISKIHLSNALSFDPQNPADQEALQTFDEPTYLHQVILKTEPLTRFKDLPDYLSDLETIAAEGRVHFHIPLYASPLDPLASTSSHADATLTHLREHPDLCRHLEIETYTWNVLPDDLQVPLTEQIIREYQWVLERS